MKNISLLLIATLAILCSPNLKAQSQIKGHVKNGRDESVPFVNVLLLSVKDSSMMKGAITDEAGTYLLDNIPFGNYRLLFKRLGYNEHYTTSFKIDGTIGQQEIFMVNLKENTEELKSVTVSAKKPFIEQAIDRTIVNVANSIIGSGSTALEVLEKSPGITIDYQKELLQMRGKEGVIVQIDGKPSYLSAQDVIGLLRSMSSDNIDKIELITNPSARYDAAGNSGIINIRLKKNNNIGTNGALSVGVGSGRYGRENGSLQLNHRTNKLNLFGNYSVSNSGGYWDFNLNQNLANPSLTNPEQRNFIKQVSPIGTYDLGQNAKAGLDFFINKHTNIGVIWTGFWSLISVCPFSRYKYTILLHIFNNAN